MRFLAKQREVIVDLRQSNQPSRAATQSSRKIFHKFEKDDKAMFASAFERHARRIRECRRDGTHRGW